MRRAVRFLLNRRRGELVVSEAVDGVDAIEKAKEEKPDLITTRPCHASLERSRSGLGLEEFLTGNSNHFVYDVYRPARRFSKRVHRC